MPLSERRIGYLGDELLLTVIEEIIPDGNQCIGFPQLTCLSLLAPACNLVGGFVILGFLIFGLGRVIFTVLLLVGLAEKTVTPDLWVYAFRYIRNSLPL